MPCLRSLLLLGLPLVAQSSARSLPETDEFDTEITAEWEDVLKSLPGESLKAAIEGNLSPKYREGVFEDGHDAIEAVRNDDPRLASKLVDLAKQDAVVKDYLRKRQDSNGTTTNTAQTVTTTSPIIVTDSSTTAITLTTETTEVVTSNPPPTTQDRSTEATTVPITTTEANGDTTVVSTPVSSTIQADEPITEPTVSNNEPVQSTQTGVLVPVEVSTTADDGSVIISTTNAFQTEAPTSIEVPVTTTNDDGETITTSTVAPAVPITSTNSQGVAIVTYTPIGGTVSQRVIRTTTLPDGQLSTVTSFADVPGPTDAPAQGEPNADGDDPTLQSAAAIPSSWYAMEVAMVVGAAIAGAALLL